MGLCLARAREGPDPAINISSPRNGPFDCSYLWQVLPADERTAQRQERVVDIGPPLVAHLQAPETVEPRQRPFHHPAKPP